MNESYKIKIKTVCDYISLNLQSNLSLEEISKVASVSKFHFHRLFFINMGITISRYILMQRFKRASYQLVFQREMKIIDIALDTGFESPEAFSRSFKNIFKVTPSQFRKEPDWESWYEKYNYVPHTMENNMKVKIVNFDEVKIAVIEHHGSPESLNETIPKFISWRKSTGLSPVGSSATYGIVYNDPGNTPPEEFHFDVCGEVKTDIPKNEFGVIQKTISKGRCAVVRHLGSHDMMGDKIYSLYRDWLPKSGESLRDFPLFFQYHNFFPEVSENELVTDIFLPIE